MTFSVQPDTAPVPISCTYDVVTRAWVCTFSGPLTASSTLATGNWSPCDGTELRPPAVSPVAAGNVVTGQGTPFGGGPCSQLRMGYTAGSPELLRGASGAPVAPFTIAMTAV